MSPALRLALCCALPLSLSCGSATRSPSPFMRDDAYLRFGVDPEAQERETVEGFEARGLSLYRRVRGKHFVALGFSGRDGRPAAVRVLTRAGVALSVDSGPQKPGQEPVEFGLLDSPRGHLADADRDGFEEVFLFRQGTGEPVERCLIPFRVRDAGFVDPVLADLGPLGAEACVESAQDVDGDGSVELIASMRFPGPPGEIEARVPVPLWPARHRFGWLGEPAQMAGHYGRVIAEREAKLSSPGVATDHRRSVRLAAELALAHYLLSGTDAALQALDEALAGHSEPGTSLGVYLHGLRERLKLPRPGDSAPEDDAAAPADAGVPAPDAGVAPDDDR